MSFVEPIFERLTLGSGNIPKRNSNGIGFILADTRNLTREAHITPNRFEGQEELRTDGKLIRGVPHIHEDLDAARRDIEALSNVSHIAQ